MEAARLGARSTASRLERAQLVLLGALLPWPNAARRAVAVLLLVLGLGVALFPGDAPGFSEPDGGMHGGGGQDESMRMMR